MFSKCKVKHEQLVTLMHIFMTLHYIYNIIPASHMDLPEAMESEVSPFILKSSESDSTFGMVVP